MAKNVKNALISPMTIFCFSVKTTSHATHLFRFCEHPVKHSFSINNTKGICLFNYFKLHVKTHDNIDNYRNTRTVCNVNLPLYCEMVGEAKARVTAFDLELTFSYKPSVVGRQVLVLPPHVFQLIQICKCVIIN